MTIISHQLGDDGWMAAGLTGLLGSVGLGRGVAGGREGLTGSLAGVWQEGGKD